MFFLCVSALKTQYLIDSRSWLFGRCCRSWIVSSQLNAALVNSKSIRGGLNPFFLLRNKVAQETNETKKKKQTRKRQTQMSESYFLSSCMYFALPSWCWTSKQKQHWVLRTTKRIHSREASRKPQTKACQKSKLRKGRQAGRRIDCLAGRTKGEKTKQRRLLWDKAFRSNTHFSAVI